jgi:Heavy-metal resistance
MTMRKTLITLGLLTCLTTVVAAQQEPICVIDGQRHPPADCGKNRPPGGEDPLARFFYPPELVMANQEAIALSERQRAAIVDAIKDAQGRFVDLQFRMSAEVERLQRLLQNSSVDETRVLDQLDRVLDVERDVKHAQLGLMIRIKNQLGPAQQAALDRIRQNQSGNAKLF